MPWVENFLKINKRRGRGASIRDLRVPLESKYPLKTLV